MAVTVRSRMDNRLPFPPWPWMVWVSSRFRRVIGSRGMVSSEETTDSLVMWLRAFFWVSFR